MWVICNQLIVVTGYTLSFISWYMLALCHEISVTLKL